MDSILFENYKRTNDNPAYGFAVTATKAFTRKVSVNGGYASIDRFYGGLNSDRFHVGNRVFVMATYVFSPRFTGIRVPHQGGRQRLPASSENAVEPDLYLQRAAGFAADGAVLNRMAGTTRSTVLPGFRLTLGFTLFYLCLIVLVPLMTLPARTATMGWSAIWQTITDPRVVASYRLSVGASLDRGGHQRRVRPASWRGCWCATGFPASASSTRSSICRSRCRRPSPASR